MHQKILHFIKYHNAFTIIFVVMFLGFGVSLAVSPEVRDSIYDRSETTVAVDNRLILDTNLDNFNFNSLINAITEDEVNYYATYSYQTLVIEDGVWQNKELTKTLEVNKESLDGKDLGLYVAGQLAENINYELDYLKRVQILEKEKGESPKIVVVAYSGLIGKLLNPKEKLIEGYSPVIPEETPTPTPTPEASQNTAIPTPEESEFPVSEAIGNANITPSLLPNFITPLPLSFTETTPSVSSTAEPSPSSSPEATSLTSPSPEPASASPSATLSPLPSPSISPPTTEPPQSGVDATAGQASPSPTLDPTPQATPESTPTTSPTGSVSPASSPSTTPEP